MSNTPRRPARTSPRRTLGKAIGSVFLTLLAGGAIYGGYLFHQNRVLPTLLGSLLRNQTVADVFPNQKAINLMVIGRDADYDDRTDQVLKSRARSDILMVAHLDFDQKTVSLLSIPRDTLAKIHTRGRIVTTKINAAHQFGGPPLSEATVLENFGIPSDKYFALDFEGFEQAIDILGGVDLVVDKKMDYDDNWGHLHIHLKPGMQHLNGKQAMGFVRFRHSDSDLIRVQRQQTLIAALKEKIKQPQMLARIGPLLDTIDRHVTSDLSSDQKVAVARFVHDIPHEKIQMVTLPSREAGNAVATNWELATPMIHDIFGVSPPETVAEIGENHRRHHRRHHRNLRVAALP